MLEQEMGARSWVFLGPRESLGWRLPPASAMFMAGPQGWAAFGVRADSRHDALVVGTASCGGGGHPLSSFVNREPTEEEAHGYTGLL